MSEPELIQELLAGKHRALARVISKIENRSPGYRELVSALHDHTGHADVIGITGSPGAGKSTLVDKLARRYREQDLTVGVIAIDPASPFTGGAVLGDRVRMASNTGDMDVFFRSMSARGALGGLSAATSDAIKALDAFGKDRVIVETVGAGQNEIDIVKTVDTVAVLVPPGSGDAVQMLKAGILEIADVFVVNKADLDGVDRLVRDLREMIELGEDRIGSLQAARGRPLEGATTWDPTIVQTVARDDEGIDDLMDVFVAHREFLDESGLREEKRLTQYSEEIQTLLREDTARLLETEVGARGGMRQLSQRVLAGETDPYGIVDELLDPVIECVEDRRRELGNQSPPESD